MFEHGLFRSKGNSSSPNAKDSPLSRNELYLDYRRISGGWIKASIPRELVKPVPLYRKGSFISLTLAEGPYSYMRCLSAYQSARWYHKHLSHISKSILILALLTSSSSQAPFSDTHTHSPCHPAVLTVRSALSCFSPCVHYSPSTAILPSLVRQLWCPVCWPCSVLSLCSELFQILWLLSLSYLQ